MNQPRTDADLVSLDTYNHVSATNDRLDGCELTHHRSCVPETLRRMAEASQPGKDHDLLPDDDHPPGPEDLKAGLALIGGEQCQLRQIERDLIEALMDAGGTWADIARARRLPTADAARMRYRDQLAGQRTWTRRTNTQAGLADKPSHDSHERWIRNAEQLRDDIAATTAELDAYIDRLRNEET